MGTFTATVPSSWQTRRQDLNDALSAIIAAFQAAVPGVIRRQWSELPDTLMAEGPFIYLGDITESIQHDAQTRTTTFTGVIGYVDTLADREETNTRINVFADYMRDLFTANVRIMPTGVLVQTGFTEGELGQGNVRMTDPHLTFVFRIQEGRPY